MLLQSVLLKVCYAMLCYAVIVVRHFFQALIIYGKLSVHPLVIPSHDSHLYRMTI